MLPAEAWRSLASSSVMFLLSSWIFSTIVYWAVWFMKSELEAGFIGSWYFSCATRSLRNIWLSTWSLRAVVVDAVLALPVLVVPLTASGMQDSWWLGARWGFLDVV